jgi:hypothetical protein
MRTTTGGPQPPLPLRAVEAPAVERGARRLLWVDAHDHPFGAGRVDGIGGLKEHLINHRKHDFAKGLTERILAYALSRDIDFHDDDLVNHLCDSFEKNDLSVPTLIREIVQSKQFRRGH